MAARRKSTGGEGAGRSGSPKPAKPDLMQVALARLDVGDRTKEQLRQLLVRKAAAARKDDAGPGEAGVPAAEQREIDEVLTRLEASGVIDDQRFAEHFVRGARTRGASSIKVQQKLGQRGVLRGDIEQALGALAAEGQDDLVAARNYARRRRLAQRYDLSDAKERQKALASLARQGFSMGIALRALGLDGRGDEGDF